MSLMEVYAFEMNKLRTELYGITQQEKSNKTSDTFDNHGNHLWDVFGT